MLIIKAPTGDRMIDGNKLIDATDEEAVRNLIEKLIGNKSCDLCTIAECLDVLRGNGFNIVHVYRTRLTCLEFLKRLDEVYGEYVLPASWSADRPHTQTVKISNIILSKCKLMDKDEPLNLQAHLDEMLPDELIMKEV